MAEINLSKYGITGTTEIVYNPSYELLFEEETKPELEGYEKGQVSELGAVNVMTGEYTGRSPKDKFIVVDENSKDTVWWTSDEYKNDNHPATQEAWNAVKDIALKELSNKRLFVVDAFCGANKDTRMAIRFIVEVAWQAHFVTNMFIRPTDEELEDLMLEREDGYYCVPEECCPICQFIEYSNCDLARFLEREYKVSRDEVFAKVKALNKRRKKLYDSEYVTEVCSRFNLNPAEIVSGLKDRFGTYRHFRDYISSR